MRNTIVGLALALLFIAGLFALSRFSPHESLQTTPAQVAAKIEPGFSGARKIGPWILACAQPQKKGAPIPFSFGPGKLKTPAAGPNPLGRCRTFLAYRKKDDPKQVILLVNFRALAQTQRLAVIVRFPPVAKKGDKLTLRLGQKALNLPVSGCEKSGCVAAGSLAPKQEQLLYGPRVGEILLPPMANGKRPTLRLPLVGLRVAIGAMRRAQVGE